MKKILLTGGSGFLGYQLLPLLCKKYSTEAIYYRRKFHYPAAKWHRLNLLEESELIKKLGELKPDAVIHAAALSNPNHCEENPLLSHHINVYASISLAQFCNINNIPFIFISSDLVFNGSMGNYAETDFCFPLSKYGLQKLEVEEYLRTECPESISCRLALLFGPGPAYSKNFFSECLNKLRSKDEIIAFSDEIRSPLSVIRAASAIVSVLDYALDNRENKEKIFHLGGKESVSRYHFAQLIADVFELEGKNIVPKLRAELPMSASRPENVSMDSALAADVLKFNPPDLRNQLLEIKNLLKDA